MEQKAIRMGIFAVILIVVLMAGCPGVTDDPITDDDPVTLPANLSDVQNAAADSSVDFLSTIEELIGTTVTTSTSVSYESATGSVTAVREGTTAVSRVAVDGAPTEGYEKQFDINFPPGGTGSEKEVEGDVTITTYAGGSWQVDGDDVKFKVQDLAGKDEMVGVKYKSTKMDPDGEIQDGDISILGALSTDEEKPIGVKTLSTLKGIGGFLKKVDKKLAGFTDPVNNPPLVPESGTAMGSPTTTYYVDGEKAATEPPSAEGLNYEDDAAVQKYTEAVGTYLGTLIALMSDNVTRETIMNTPRMVSSDALKALGVDASITTSSTDSMKITKPDANNLQYTQTMVIKLTGSISLTENGKTQTLEFVEMNQESEFSQTISLTGQPSEDDIPDFKARYTGSIKFNDVELKLTNGKMKHLLSFQKAMAPDQSDPSGQSQGG